MLIFAGPQDREPIVETSVLKLTVRGVEAPDFDFCIYPDAGHADFDRWFTVAGQLRRCRWSRKDESS